MYVSRPSNRSRLVEGALRCLERLPPERVTARAITRESGTNLGSISHHFGAKEELVTEAMLLGLERWHQDVVSGLAHLGDCDPAMRMSAAAELAGRLCRRQPGLARTFIAALARAQHDPLVRQRLAGDFVRTQRQFADYPRLGSGETGLDAAGLQALLVGTLAQTMVARLDTRSLRPQCGCRDAGGGDRGTAGARA